MSICVLIDLSLVASAAGLGRGHGALAEAILEAAGQGAHVTHAALGVGGGAGEYACGLHATRAALGCGQWLMVVVVVSWGAHVTHNEMGVRVIVCAIVRVIVCNSEGYCVQ